MYFFLKSIVICQDFLRISFTSFILAFDNLSHQKILNNSSIIKKVDEKSNHFKLAGLGSFDFQEKIQMNVIGKIGDKLQLNTNYNTEAIFEFDNKIKLEYEGEEDEIIKKTLIK